MMLQFNLKWRTRRLGWAEPKDKILTFCNYLKTLPVNFMVFKLARTLNGDLMYVDNPGLCNSMPLHMFECFAPTNL